MPVSKLRRLLEDEAGFEDFCLTIPHPLLPPRFHDLCENRNMILVLDDSMTIRVTWEGSRFEEYYPLNPAAAGRLLAEVQSNMTNYRRDLQIFERFIRQWGEKPFDVPRFLDPPLGTTPDEQGAEREAEVVADISTESNELTTSESLRQRLLKGATSE